MYGYKKHFVTDTQGIVLNVVTTPANVNEIANLEEVLHGLELAKGRPTPDGSLCLQSIPLSRDSYVRT